MAEDNNDMLANMIILIRAGNKTKAKSFLTASLQHGLSQAEEVSNGAEDVTDCFAGVEGDDELAGIGAPRPHDEHDIAGRQLLNSNDALRRKLLSKDAYKKYQQVNKHGVSGSKPMPRHEQRQMDDLSEDEGKGRSGHLRRKQAPEREHPPNEIEDDSNKSMVASDDSVSLRSAAQYRKRPGSYMDQLLAERSRKKRSKK